MAGRPSPSGTAAGSRRPDDEGVAERVFSGAAAVRLAAAVGQQGWWRARRGAHEPLHHRALGERVEQAGLRAAVNPPIALLRLRLAGGGSATVASAAVAAVAAIVATAGGDAHRVRLEVPRQVAWARGPSCHSALSFSVPIGILHINENETRRNGSAALA
jgi:hypothetical protein